jgi:alanine-synthesizing transaminase
MEKTNEKVATHMTTFEKSDKLDDVAYDIRGPVLDEANRMRANGEKILRLNTGNPAEFGFTAPDEVIRDLIMNARDSEGYSDSKGIFSARKAIMQYCQVLGFPNVDVDDIYTGNGVSELISMSMNGLLNTGDEVLVPMPDYPLWTASISLAGGHACIIYVMSQRNGILTLQISSQKLRQIRRRLSLLIQIIRQVLCILERSC